MLSCTISIPDSMVFPFFGSKAIVKVFPASIPENDFTSSLSLSPDSLTMSKSFQYFPALNVYIKNSFSFIDFLRFRKIEMNTVKCLLDY